MSETAIEIMAFAGIAACLLICVLGMRYAERADIRRRQGKLSDQEATTMRVEVERLAARVEVLERLVTDADRRLAGEIEGLRRSEGASRQT